MPVLAKLFELLGRRIAQSIEHYPACASTCGWKAKTHRPMG
jgi:hypothetical protein